MTCEKENGLLVQTTDAVRPCISGVSARDLPELSGLVMEMASGLDNIRNNLNCFLTKVEEGGYSTKEGISYLEAKHLLLFFYCQFVIFYTLLKAEGRSIQNHPVVARLIEIRLFLEKIRPIDKRLHYQVEKLLRLATDVPHASRGKEGTGLANEEDALMYKPNPDMLVSKIDAMGKETTGVYRPPMIAPTTMDDERVSKDRRLEARKQKLKLQKASNSSFIKELADELEGRPEEVKESIRLEDSEMARDIHRFEARAKQEEDLFARVPLSRVERKKLKHLKRSQYGLGGMLDGFDADVAGLFESDEKTYSQHELEESAYLSKKLRNPKKTTHFKRMKTKKKSQMRTKSSG